LVSHLQPLKNADARAISPRPKNLMRKFAAQNLLPRVEINYFAKIILMEA
jgi:hypothetical protein